MKSLLIVREETEDSIIVETKLPKEVARYFTDGYAIGWLEIDDKRLLSIEQRKKWFALVGDFSNFTGYPPDYSHILFKTMYEILHDKENISMSNVDMTTAKEMIDMLLSWVFENGIPVTHSTGSLFKSDINWYYHLAHEKYCFICGGQHEKAARHTHHVDKIKMGHNRNKVIHIGRRIMILCGPHHDEYHNSGHTKFLDKYHIEMIVLTEELAKKLKLDLKKNE